MEVEAAMEIEEDAVKEARAHTFQLVLDAISIALRNAEETRKQLPYQQALKDTYDFVLALRNSPL